jgi:hypothetical protein
MAVVSATDGGVLVTGSLSSVRICRGLSRKCWLAWQTPCTASAAPATIGDAEEVPEKDPVYVVVAARSDELKVSTFSPQP